MRFSFRFPAGVGEYGIFLAVVSETFLKIECLLPLTEQNMIKYAKTPHAQTDETRSRSALILTHTHTHTFS